MILPVSWRCFWMQWTLEPEHWVKWTDLPVRLGLVQSLEACTEQRSNPPPTACLWIGTLVFPQPLDLNWNISSFWILTLGICRSWAISTSIIMWVNSLLYNPFLYKCLCYQFYFSREPWLIDTVYCNSLCILVFSISLWRLRGQRLSHNYKHTAQPCPRATAQ